MLTVLVLFTGIMLESLLYVRPVMSLDAAHMKTTGGGGTMYIASVKSATNELYPVAVSLMLDPENKAGWMWFLEHMKACLPVLDTEHRKANVAYKRFTFMSDRNKGLLEALKEVFPLNHSCCCAIHIARNVESKFGAKNAKFVVQLAKTFSTTYADDILQRMNVPARTYVSKIDAQVWRSVAWLQDESLPPRYGIVTSNMSESVNNMFENARDVHWLSSLNMMLTKMAERIATLSDKYMNRSGVVSQVQAILQNHWNCCAGMKVLPMKDEREELFTVLEPPRQGVYNDPTGYNLNTSLKACDCGMWQEHGFPCIHAVAIFRKKEVSFAELLETVDDIHTYEMNVQLFKRTFSQYALKRLYLTGQCWPQSSRRERSDVPRRNVTAWDHMSEQVQRLKGKVQHQNQVDQVEQLDAVYVVLWVTISGHAASQGGKRTTQHRKRRIPLTMLFQMWISYKDGYKTKQKQEKKIHEDA